MSRFSRFRTRRVCTIITLYGNGEATRLDAEYYRLIIVDDEERARRSLSKYLDWHALGFHVAAALEDGSDAIAYMQAHPVDAVLTDIQMFEASGLELARWVQAHRSETRVVILSGYDEIEYVHAAIESEAVDFLVKPVMKDALIRAFEKVRKKLDGQRASRYSLRHLVSPEVEERENTLARAAAGGDRAAFDGAWQAWLSAAQDCIRRDAFGAGGAAGEERLSAAGRRRRADAGGAGAGCGLSPAGRDAASAQSRNHARAALANHRTARPLRR